LCLDPAISKCGWSILDYKAGSSKVEPAIMVVRWGTITAGGEANKVANKDEREKFGRRILSLLILRHQLIELIDEFCPEHIVVEDAFYNKAFPSAFAALEQCITTVCLMAKDMFNLMVYRVPTKCAKKAIARFGDSNKVDVLDSILASKYITFRQKKQSQKLDHHSADSIAVGVYFLSQIWSTVEPED
jgi:Holliday junction resolvasome RuvABC endonuclease subunit